MAEQTAVLVLAAGKGTRMKSDLAKVLHPLMGQPLLAHVLNSARYVRPERIVVVVGHQAELVERALAGEELIFARQTEQLGTGHAVAAAREALADFQGTVLILSGDVPLLSPQTMMDFLAAHRESRVSLSVLTVDLADPGHYGRVIRDQDGYLQRIVEARDAGPEELAVTEINTGIYAADVKPLFEAVARLGTDNDQREYYLTDVAEDFRNRGLKAAAIMCPDPQEVLGVNDRSELARIGDILRYRTNQAWMRAGVTMIDPDSIYIETSVRLSPDVTVWPSVCLLGRTHVASGAVIEAGCWLKDVVIGAKAVIRKGSVLEGAAVEAGSSVGPLAVVTAEN